MFNLIEFNPAHVLEFLKSSSTIIVTWLGIVLTVWFAYYTFKFKLSSSLIKEQLYKAYLPMFKMMEPYLYKDMQEIGSHRFKNLMDELEQHCNLNYELVEPQIISYNRRIIRSLNDSKTDKTKLNEMYKRLCSKIDFEFEKTRRKLGLPNRNVFYKLNHRQYESKLELFFYMFLATWRELAIMIIICYIAIRLIG